MFVSEDGTVTGSVDVSRLDQIEAKTDEARAQLGNLKAEVQAGQEQVERDAERASQGERAVGINSTGRDDGDADERAASRKAQQADAERQQREADQKRQAEQAVAAEREQADAEAAKATKSASAQKRG